MIFFIWAFLMISNANLFAQVSQFGIYRLKTSAIGDSVTTTILKLNCDFTYSRYNTNTKKWGKWQIDRDNVMILDRDSISNEGSTIKYQVKGYYNWHDGKLFLDER